MTDKDYIENVIYYPDKVVMMEELGYKIIIQNK